MPAKIRLPPASVAPEEGELVAAILKRREAVHQALEFA